ncbi:MAG: hypothetical protein ACLFP1_08675 [Candidatus Goldiibacteriota bacterium]
MDDAQKKETEQNAKEITEPQPETAAGEEAAEDKTRQKTGKIKEKEFSMRWHLKVLAVIYAALFVFYLVLKFTLE